MKNSQNNTVAATVSVQEKINFVLQNGDESMSLLSSLTGFTESTIRMLLSNNPETQNKDTQKRAPNRKPRKVIKRKNSMRKWTKEDLLYIASHPNAKAKTIARKIGRTVSSVANARCRIKSGDLDPVLGSFFSETTKKKTPESKKLDAADPIKEVKNPILNSHEADDQIKKAIELYESGLNVRDITRLLTESTVSYRTVARWIEKYKSNLPIKVNSTKRASDITPKGMSFSLLWGLIKYQKD